MSTLTKVKTLHKTEPVLTGFAGLVTSIIAVLVAFGVHLTDTQEAALVGLAVIIGGPVVAWIRSKVSPTG